MNADESVCQLIDSFATKSKVANLVDAHSAGEAGACTAFFKIGMDSAGRTRTSIFVSYAIPEVFMLLFLAIFKVLADEPPGW